MKIHQAKICSVLQFTPQYDILHKDLDALFKLKTLKGFIAIKRAIIQIWVFSINKKVQYTEEN